MQQLLDAAELLAPGRRVSGGEGRLGAPGDGERGGEGRLWGGWAPVCVDEAAYSQISREMISNCQQGGLRKLNSQVAGFR